MVHASMARSILRHRSEVTPSSSSLTLAVFAASLKGVQMDGKVTGRLARCLLQDAVFGIIGVGLNRAILLIDEEVFR